MAMNRAAQGRDSWCHKRRRGTISSIGMGEGDLWQACSAAADVRPNLGIDDQGLHGNGLERLWLTRF